jgi:hypothetical protein
MKQPDRIGETRVEYLGPMREGSNPALIRHCEIAPELQSVNRCGIQRASYETVQSGSRDTDFSDASVHPRLGQCSIA